MAPPPPQYGAPQPPRGPVTPKGLAIAALIVGIVALVTAWVPVLGFILGAVGLILGILALAKKQPKGLGLTGLILSVVALIVSIVVTIIGAVALFTLGAAVDELEAAPTQTESPLTPGETTPDTDTPTDSDFPEVSASELADMVSDPASWAGRSLTVYGEVVSFVPYLEGYSDQCGMDLFISNAPMADTADYEHYVLAYSGDWDAECPVFDPLFPGDNVALAVTVVGEEVFETEDGGTNSAPQLEVWMAEVQ